MLRLRGQVSGGGCIGGRAALPYREVTASGRDRSGECPVAARKINGGRRLVWDLWRRVPPQHPRLAEGGRSAGGAGGSAWRIFFRNFPRISGVLWIDEHGRWLLAADRQSNGPFRVNEMRKGLSTGNDAAIDIFLRPASEFLEKKF